MPRPALPTEVETARAALPLLVILATAAACGGSTPPQTRAQGDTTIAIPPAQNPDPSAPTSPRPVASAAPCPIVPLVLTIRGSAPATGSPTRVMTLAEDGQVAIPVYGSVRAELDENGCLAVDGEIAVDGSSAHEIWTTYERFVTKGDRIELAGGRSMRIFDDGSVKTYDHHGNPEQPTPFAFEGYRPSAACAARVMLIAFFASMPSMAFSDGNPQRLPPPAGSPCFRAKKR